MANKEPLLSLSTNKYIKKVKFDDKEYGYIMLSKLSPIQQNKLREHGLFLADGKNTKTEKGLQECDKHLLESLILIIPEAGRSLLSKFSVSEKLQILNDYDEAANPIKKKVTQLVKGKRAKKKKR